MEYQKIANLIDDDASNQPSKFRTRNCVEINDESRGAYNAYILVKGTISVNNTAAQGAAANNTDKNYCF